MDVQCAVPNLTDDTRPRHCTTVAAALRSQSSSATVAAALHASPFLHEDGEAFTLSGNYEALFALTEIDALKGFAPSDTRGVMDLGGASTQLVFRPEGANPTITQDAYRMYSVKRKFILQYSRKGMIEQNYFKSSRDTGPLSKKKGKKLSKAGSSSRDDGSPRKDRRRRRRRDDGIYGTGTSKSSLVAKNDVDDVAEAGSDYS